MTPGSGPSPATSYTSGMTEEPETEVRLVDIGSHNWRDVAAVTARAEQTEFVAPTTYYLCLSHFHGDWTCLAVETDGEIVGHVMWALDDDAGWIGGLVVDARRQGAGIGAAAVEALCSRLSERPEITNIALSYAPQNAVARRLYARLGFVETGEMEGDELVARRPSS